MYANFAARIAPALGRAYYEMAAAQEAQDEHAAALANVQQAREYAACSLNSCHHTWTPLGQRMSPCCERYSDAMLFAGPHSLSVAKAVRDDKVMVLGLLCCPWLTAFAG